MKGIGGINFIVDKRKKSGTKLKEVSCILVDYNIYTNYKQKVGILQSKDSGSLHRQKKYRRKGRRSCHGPCITHDLRSY